MSINRHLTIKEWQDKVRTAHNINEDIREHKIALSELGEIIEDLEQSFKILQREFIEHLVDFHNVRITNYEEAMMGAVERLRNNIKKNTKPPQTN